MPDISDKVNQIEQEQQAKARTPEGGLEKKTKGGIFRRLIEFGYMAATTAAAWAIAGPLNLVSVTGTYLLVHAILNRKNLKYEGLRKELHLGNAMTGLLYYFFKAFNTIAADNFLLNTAFILGVGIPAFNAFFIPFRYMIYNYTPLKLLKDTLTFKIPEAARKIKQKFKEEYIPATKRTYLVSPVIIAARNFIPFQYQLAATSVSRFFYRLALGRGGKDGYKTNPYPKKALQPT